MHFAPPFRSRFCSHSSPSPCASTNRRSSHHGRLHHEARFDWSSCLASSGTRSELIACLGSGAMRLEILTEESPDWITCSLRLYSFLTRASDNRPFCRQDGAEGNNTDCKVIVCSSLHKVNAMIYKKFLLS